MQKESPADEGELQAAKAQGRASRTSVASTASPKSASPKTSIGGLEVALENGQSQQTAAQAKRDSSAKDRSSLPACAHGAPQEQVGACSSEVDIQIVMEPRAQGPDALPSQEDKRPGRPVQDASIPNLDTKPPKAQKKSSAQKVIVNMMEKPSSSVFSPPRRKLPFSK